MTSSLTILQLPDIPLKLMLGYLNLKSIQALRKVCRGFRNFIHDTELDPQILKLEIVVFSRTISFKYSDSQSYGIRNIIEYQKFSNGCLVVFFDSVGRREKFVKDQNFEKVFCEDFRVILEHQKMKIKDFRLAFNYYPRELKMERDKKLKRVARRFFDSLKIVLESRRRQLPVESLLLEILYQRELEQWKNAEELGLLYFTVTIPIENLFHASKLSINLEKISAQEMFLLKEAFMSSPNFSSAFVNYNQLDDWRSLIKLLGTPFDDFVEFGAARRRWFYRIPENDQKALCVHFRSFSIFHFERIALCLVPKNGFEGESHHSNF